MNCLLCGVTIESKYDFRHLFHTKKTLICHNCLTKLERVKGGCIRCGKKTDQELCEDCTYWTQNKDINFELKNKSLYYYNGFGKKVMHQMKFSGDLRIIYAFKDEISIAFKKRNKKTYYLIPTPIHEERLLERGFNQSLAIAHLMPYKIIDVIKKRNNDKQSKKKKSERMIFDDNFYLEQPIDFSGKNVIIVDDIYTTGATVHKIAKVLHDHGAKEIISFTLFRS